MALGICRLPIGMNRASGDPDAAAWAAAVTANGGTYSAGTLTKLSTLIAGMKAASLWTKMACFGPLCGDQLAAALIQYKGGVWASATNVNFVGGDYTEATGLTGNGSTKYLNTGLLANALTANDTHLCVYNRAGSVVGGGTHMGAGVIASNGFELFAPFTDGVAYSDHYDNTGGRVSSAVAAPYGLITGSRTGAAAHTVYKGSTQLATNATSAGSLPALAVYVFAENANGTPIGFVSHPLAIYSAGAGLSAGDVTNYSALVQTFQTAMGRNV